MTRFFVMIAAVVFAIMWLVIDAKADVFITIDKSEQEMVVQTPEEVYVWDVSTGRKGFRTPTGDFQPYYLNRMHYSRKYDNAPMPHSIFFLGGFAIHGTDAVDKLGRPASHGCVRLHPQNARWLFEVVKYYGKQNTYITIVE